jgi:Sulfotransferase family
MASPDTPLIHIGFYKSASSWLQKFLFVPEFGYQQLVNPFSLHSQLVTPTVEAFEPDNFKNTVAAELAAMADGPCIPVISSEALAGELLRGGYNRWQNADRLKQVFDRARILLVVREQQQLIRSMYKTMVFFGMPYSVSSMLRRGLAGAAPGTAEFDIEFIRFHSLARHYASLYGDEAVLVLPYELFKQRPLEFLNRVYSHCGRNQMEPSRLQQLPLGQVVNAGESLFFIHLQRWVNRFTLTRYRDYAGPFGSNGFDQVLKRISWHKRHARETALDARLERRFAAQVRGHVQGGFADSNRQLQAFCPVDLGSFAYEM